MKYPKQEQDFIDECKVNVFARNPLVYVQTFETIRAIGLLHIVADKTSRNIFVWKPGIGYVNDKNIPLDPATADIMVALQRIESEKPILYIFQDMKFSSSMLRNMEDIVISYLKSISDSLSSGKATIFIVSSTSVPPDLAEYVRNMLLPFPDAEVIKIRILSEMEKKELIQATESEKEHLSRIFTGLSLARIECIAAEITHKYKSLSENAIPEILRRKADYIKSTGILEVIDVSKAVDAVGYENLREWRRKKFTAFTEEGEKEGLEKPKGIFLSGIPGCGKSHQGKQFAKDWDMLLLHLDIGRIFGRYVGQSEENIRLIITIAEACAPCILWIDEIEKGFSISGDGDGGTGKRVFGILLTWLQEKTSTVFLFVTANDITKLPPEFARLGRFDAIFFLDLPNETERQALFKIHAAKRKINLSDLEISSLANMSDGYSGAEIEECLKASKFEVYGKGPVTFETVSQEIKNIIPLSISRREEISYLRNWAKTRALSASKSLVKNSGNGGNGRWTNLEIAEN
jgi:AAA+ superfamily predicted ATPase